MKDIISNISPLNEEMNGMLHSAVYEVKTIFFFEYNNVMRLYLYFNNFIFFDNITEYQYKTPDSFRVAQSYILVFHLSLF